MPYLSKTQHDIFVSYAHGPAPWDLLGDWSRRFKVLLQSHLDHLMGTKDPNRRVSIWMDQTLSGNQPLTDEIRDAVQHSALLLVIMSRYYFETDWCADEARWFAEAAAATGGHRDHIFVVRAEPTRETLWPPSLRDSSGHVLTGYKFFTSSDEDDAEILGWHSSAEARDDPGFSRAVERLAKDMSRQLRHLAETEGTSPPHALTGRSVFLGLTHDTIEDREALRSSLSAAGLGVLPPEADDPVDEASLREAMERHLPQAEAMVLIANKYLGGWPRNEPGGFIGLQIQEARRRNIPCHLWLQIGDLAEVKKPEYRDYLASLPVQPSAAVRVWRNDLAGFVAQVVNGLATQPPPQGEAEEEPLAVICANEAQDSAIGRQVEDAVNDTLSDIGLSSHGFKFKDPRNEQIKLANLGKRIKEAGAVVVLCFDQEWDWARPLLRQLHLLSPPRDDGKAKLLIAGPEDRQEGIYNAYPLGFRTIDGVNLDVQQLRQRLREAIIAALPPRGTGDRGRANRQVA
jgi:hypothetical protein